MIGHVQIKNLYIKIYRKRYVLILYNIKYIDI